MFLRFSYREAKNRTHSADQAAQFEAPCKRSTITQQKQQYWTIFMFPIWKTQKQSLRGVM